MPSVETSRFTVSFSCLRSPFFPLHSGLRAVPCLRALLWGADCRLRVGRGMLTQLFLLLWEQPERKRRWNVTLPQPASTSGPAGNGRAWPEEGPGCRPECPGPRRAGCQGSAFSWQAIYRPGFLLPASSSLLQEGLFCLFGVRVSCSMGNPLSPQPPPIT